jgi:hypothetical protein
MSDATPPLDEFLTEFDENDNAWWYLSSGNHLNLFEEAVDKMQTAEAAVRRVQAALDPDVRSTP